MTLAKVIADPAIDEAAQNSLRLLPLRMLVLLGGLPFAIGALGTRAAISVTAMILAGELWMFLASRPFARNEPATDRLRLNFVLSAFATSCAWLSLSGAYWISGDPTLRITAVAMWAAHLFFVLSFMQSSKLTFAVTGVPANLMAMGLPLAVRIGDTPMAWYATACLVLCFGFTPLARGLPIPGGMSCAR